MIIKHILAVASLLCLLTGWSRADMVMYSDTIPFRSTDWGDTATIVQFDPVLGTLVAIGIQLQATARGSIGVENIDAASNDITTIFQVDLELRRPDASLITTARPSVTLDQTFPGYDGVTDFGGTSGTVYPGLSDTDTGSYLSPPPLSDFLLFIGTGTIDLTVTATDSSTSFDNDSNKLDPIFSPNSEAQAVVTVVYTYLVPEPATFSLLAISAVLVCIRRRRR